MRSRSSVKSLTCCLANHRLFGLRVKELRLLHGLMCLDGNGVGMSKNIRAGLGMTDSSWFWSH